MFEVYIEIFAGDFTQGTSGYCAWAFFDVCIGTRFNLDRLVLQDISVVFLEWALLTNSIKSHFYFIGCCQKCVVDEGNI